MVKAQRHALDHFGSSRDWFFDAKSSGDVIGYMRPQSHTRFGKNREEPGPVKSGEIIHVFAIRFGPVTPEVRDGVPEPAEPLARLSQRLTYSNSEILYAGLAPGYFERIYQVDLRLGRTPGYQKFDCTLDGSQLFKFLTLNVVE